MFTCSHTIAQQVSLFQSIGTQDGLPSNYIMAIEEDANGYLWLGTDKGLAKYDGFSWKTFTTDDGLPGNYIGFIKKAGTNGLWIGISDKGLYHYNFETKKATPLHKIVFIISIKRIKTITCFSMPWVINQTIQRVIVYRPNGHSK